MQLQTPFMISARLLPALKIGDTFISMQFGGERAGRAVYQYFIDSPDFQFENDDIESGVGGGSLQAGFISLLSFLSACADSRKYRRNFGGGENADLFPDNIGEWAENFSDEISLLQCELEEGEFISE